MGTYAPEFTVYPIHSCSKYGPSSLVPRPPRAFIACSMKSGKLPSFHTASDKSLGRPGYEAMVLINTHAVFEVTFVLCLD